MNSIVLTAMLPVVALIAAGAVLGRSGWIGPRLLRWLGDLAFMVLTPILLFRAMSKVHLEHLDLRPALVYAISLLGVYAGVLAWRGWNRKAGVLGLAATYSNGVMIGIPLVGLAYGDAGQVTLFTLIPVHSLVLLTSATVVLELMLAQSQAAAPSGIALRVLRVGGRALRKAFIHPVPLPILAGLLWAQTGWSLPVAVDTGMRWIGSGFGPIALVLVGISVARVSVGAHWRGALLLTVLKNAVVPLVTAAVGHLLGLSGMPLLVTVMTASLPAGANAFIFAQRYGGSAQELVAAAVALSTTLAVLSVSLVMLLMGPA